MTCQPKSRLHGCFGVLAFFQLDHGLRERLHERGLVCPAEVAAAILGTGILGLLGQILELVALLEAGDDGLGLVLGLDQNVADLVFLVAELQADVLVFLLQHLIGDRVRLDVLVEIGTDQDALTRHHHLALDLGLLVQALLLRGLHQHFAANQFFLDGLAQFRRVFLALGDLAGHQRVGTGFGNGLAVDSGDGVGAFGAEGHLRERGGKGDQRGDEQLAIHRGVLKLC